MLDRSQYTRGHLPGGMALGICCAGRWPEPTQNSSGASSFVRPARDFYSALLPCARNPQCPTQCRTPCARNSQCRTSSPKTAASIRRRTSFLYMTAPVAGGTALQIPHTRSTALGTGAAGRNRRRTVAVHHHLRVLFGTSTVPYSHMRGIRSALPSAVLPVRGFRSAVPRAQRRQHK